MVAKHTKTYAEMMVDLQTILRDMQSGALDVDETIAKYEQGQKLVLQLEAYLKEAKNTISQRKADDGGGVI